MPAPMSYLHVEVKLADQKLLKKLLQLQADVAALERVKQIDQDADHGLDSEAYDVIDGLIERKAEAAKVLAQLLDLHCPSEKCKATKVLLGAPELEKDCCWRCGTGVVLDYELPSPSKAVE